MMNLPVTVAILLECTTKELQFSWETFLVADVESMECLLVSGNVTPHSDAG
jgi:hypothetical protein